MAQQIKIKNQAKSKTKSKPEEQRNKVESITLFKPIEEQGECSEGKESEKADHDRLRVGRPRPINPLR